MDEEYGYDGGVEQGEALEPQRPTDPLEALSQYGVPEELARELRNGYQRQADYTRKTQELAEYRQILLQGGAQAQPQQQQQVHLDPVEEVLAEFDDGTEQSAHVKAILSKLNSAWEKKTAMAMAPVRQATADNLADRSIAQHYSSNVLPEYGEAVGPIYQQAYPEIKRRILAGETVDVQTELFRANPEGMAELILAKKRNQQQQRGARTQEGFATKRQASPALPWSNTPTQKPPPADTGPKTRGQAYASIDSEMAAKAILAKMGTLR